MLLDYWQKIYTRFLKLRGTPRELALGFSLGIFIGFTPTMGIQVALGVVFASLFKWSKITAAIGVQVTNPFTAPFVYSFTYYLGAKIMGLDNPFNLGGEMSLDSLIGMFREAPGIFAAMTLGGVLIGLPAAGVGYFAAYRILNRYHEKLKTGIRSGTWKIRNGMKKSRTNKGKKIR